MLAIDKINNRSQQNPPVNPLPNMIYSICKTEAVFTAALQYDTLL